MKLLRGSLWVIAIVLLCTLPGFSQVRFSTPFTDAYYPPPISAYVDDGGCRDFRCGTNTYCGHCGTDMAVGLGTPVYAPANGYISQINTGCGYGYYCDQCGGGFGNFIRMYAAIDGSWSYVMAHLSEVYYGSGTYGDCNNGPMLGRTGSSGCSTGPHLHFQVYHYGGCQADDPYDGDCSCCESFWVCQNHNQDICSNACQ